MSKAELWCEGSKTYLSASKGEVNVTRYGSSCFVAIVVANSMLFVACVTGTDVVMLSAIMACG